MTWFEKIHQQAVHCSRRFKRAEYEMVLALQAVDSKKVFRKLGYGSLFEYSVKALALPEGTAYAFINVARKSATMPKIKTALESGKVSVSQVKRVLSVMTPATQDLWIEKAATMKQRDLERELSPEKTAKLELRVDTLLEEKIKRAKEVFSQKNRKVPSMEEALSDALDTYLEKYDPLEIAARKQERRRKRKIRGSVQTTAKQTSVASPAQPGLAKKLASAIRRSLPQKIIEEIYLRDQGSCQYTNCQSRTFLDIHHVIPRSQGGSDTLENLRLLCRSHHQLLHERKYLT